MPAQHKSTWKHADTQRHGQGCLINPPDDSKAQSCLGNRVNHLGKGEERWWETCDLSQRLCQGLWNQGGRQGFPELTLVTGRGLSRKEERSVMLDSALASTFLGSYGPKDFFSLPSESQYNDTLPPGLHPL